MPAEVEERTKNTTLNGKVALVTGGSRGIGEEIVRHLAGNGACVAFTYASNSQRAEELVHILGDSVAVKAYKSNVADMADVELLVSM